MNIKSILNVSSAAVIMLSVSMPAQALFITLGSTTIWDGAAGDLNPTAGIIDFNLTSINGVSGTYNASGKLTESITGTTASISSTAMTLTNLDIEATSGTVGDTILFQSTNGPIMALPATGSVELDGNWTSGSGSNAPAAVSGGSVSLNATLFGDWQWSAMTATSAEFVGPFGTSPLVSSGSGSSFGPVGSPTTVMPGVGDTFFGQLVNQADFTSIVGRLDFNLANIGDGLWLPGSADVHVVSDAYVSSVPVPAAVWLFGSGLLAMFGFARRR